MSAFAVVRQLRIFMHFAPYAVSGVGMRAEIALALDIFFDRRTNITAAIADHHQAGRDLERFGCHIDQMLCLRLISPTPTVKAASPTET